jgi:hypothetical protein
MARMCFMLYAGSAKPIPRIAWKKEAPAVSVRTLLENERPIRLHFASPEIQFIGSTSGCGCDFPKTLLQGNEWPVAEGTEIDLEHEETCRFNRQGLAELLEGLDEDVIELYGMWAGHESETPLIREQIPLNRILDPDFRFKERGFYEVRL